MLSTSKNEEVSQNCFVFDVVKFKKWRSLAELPRFWCCQAQKPRKSRRIASFSSLHRCSKMQPLSRNQRPDLLTALMRMSLVLCLPRKMHVCKSSSNVPRCPSPAIVFGNATKPSRLAHFWQGPQSLALATRNDIWTSKSGPYMLCFVHFDFEMPQQRALFRHLNFEKRSDRGVLCTFWLRHVLRATTACTFSTSQLPKAFQRCGVFSFFTCKCVSHYNSVHFFDISTYKNAPNVTWFSPHLCVGFLFLILYPGSSSFSSSALPLAHTIFHSHTQLCHTSSYNYLSHTTLSHTIFHIQLCHTSSFTYMAAVALGDVCLRFTWQAWHLATCASFRGTWRHPPSFCVASVALMALGWLWWRAWTGLVAGDAAALCMAGVALGDVCLRFTWQAWHLATCASFRGTYGTGLALVARLDWTSRRWRRGTLRGRRGTWRHTFVSRGRRGTWWHPPKCVAGVALMALGWLWLCLALFSCCLVALGGSCHDNLRFRWAGQKTKEPSVIAFLDSRMTQWF